MDEVEKGFQRRKAVFLNGVQTEVNRYIVSTGKNCVAVVERNSDGSVYCTWNFSDDIDDLCKHVYLFMRKKKSSGGRIHDSALTDPIIKIVTQEYKDFYTSESDNISTGVLTALSSDEIKLQSFVDRLSSIALHGLTKKAKDQVVKLVVHQIKESVNQGALHAVGQQVAHVATTTAGTQVAAIVGHLLLKLLATHISTIVAHVLASTALQHVLIGIVKKFVVGAVTVAVFNFLTVHFGAALAGASVLWVVLPIIVGYMAYKIHGFPKELGEKVSKSVRSELDSRFENMNRTILEKIFDSVFHSEELVKAIADDEQFQDAMRNLGNKAEPTLGMLKHKYDAFTSIREVSDAS